MINARYFQYPRKKKSLCEGRLGEWGLPYDYSTSSHGTPFSVSFIYHPYSTTDL
jgi:hypothetical protein